MKRDVIEAAAYLSTRSVQVGVKCLPAKRILSVFSSRKSVAILTKQNLPGLKYLILF